MTEFITQAQIWLTSTGEWLMPILLAVVTVLDGCLPILTRFKLNGLVENLNDLKGLLQALLNKDTGEEAIKTLGEKVDTELSKLSKMSEIIVNQTSQNVMLGHMLSTIFQYSSLPPEVKEHLRALEANLEYGADGDYLESLIKENKDLKTRLSNIQHDAATIAETAVTVEEVKPSKKTYLQVT